MRARGRRDTSGVGALGPAEDRGGLLVVVCLSVVVGGLSGERVSVARRASTGADAVALIRRGVGVAAAERPEVVVVADDLLYSGVVLGVSPAYKVVVRVWRGTQARKIVVVYTPYLMTWRVVVGTVLVDGYSTTAVGIAT